MGFFLQSNLPLSCSLLRLLRRKMGAQSEIGYNSTPKWLNSTPKWLSSDDFLEEGVGEGVLWPIIPTLRITYVYDQSLTTASENRLFGSVVDH